MANKLTTPSVPPAQVGTSVEARLSGRTAVVIGRDLECDIVIHDVKASRKHCRLSRAESAFLLEDLGSKNGTFVDGRRITAPVTLLQNQTFKVGDTMFYLSP